MDSLNLKQFWALLEPFNKHRLAGALGIKYEACMNMCNHWQAKDFMPVRAVLIEGISGGKVSAAKLAPIYNWDYINAHPHEVGLIDAPFVIDLNNQSEVLNEVD